MGTFNTIIQPVIVKTAATEEQKGIYLVNWNAYSLVDEMDKEYLGADIPRVFFDPKVGEATISATIKYLCYNGVLETPGIGEWWWVNRSLAEWVGILSTESFWLPDYLTGDGVSPDYVILENDAFISIDYYAKQNEIILSEYTEEQIANFYSTFASFILDGTEISEETALAVNNQIYKMVLNYLAKYKYDDATIALTYILGTVFTTTSKGTSCGCNKNNTTASITTDTCLTTYTNAMLEYVKRMLGDADFYVDWMYKELEDGNKMPLTDMIDNLIRFIQAFIDRAYDLTFDDKAKKYYCTCPKGESDKSKENYQIISNYIKVLEWVRDCQISVNKNKIKTYGEAFGAILPNLEF